jgi:hypothetical protein
MGIQEEKCLKSWESKRKLADAMHLLPSDSWCADLERDTNILKYHFKLNAVKRHSTFTFAPAINVKSVVVGCIFFLNFPCVFF